MKAIYDETRIDSAKIRALHQYWRSIRTARVLPSREDVELLDIGALMPNVMIVEFEQDPFRVKYRLVGTRVVEMSGFEFTGKYLDEIVFPDVLTEFERAYRQLVKGRRPMLGRTECVTPTEEQNAHDVGVFPLSSDGRTVDMALVIECYDELERRYSRYDLVPGLIDREWAE